MELLRELWDRALTTQPPPDPLVPVLVAVVLVVFAWSLVRTVVTLCHEAGHAVVATMTGRELTGIRLHSDASGLTLSRGRAHGPGMVAMLAAGYPAASFVGLGAAALAGAGYAAGLLWLFVLLLALMLVKIRNLYGALVVLSGGIGVALVSWYAAPQVLSGLALALAWTLLLAGPRPVWQFLTQPRLRASSHSDAAQLARLTGVPAVVWGLLWLVVTLGALALGVWWTWPGLAWAS